MTSSYAGGIEIEDYLSYNFPVCEICKGVLNFYEKYYRKSL